MRSDLGQPVAMLPIGLVYKIWGHYLTIHSIIDSVQSCRKYCSYKSSNDRVADGKSLFVYLFTG